ncbi:MAG: nuclease [Anaerolinea sp.]|nr:nuclease [Anaerolinea sp.]
MSRVVVLDSGPLGLLVHPARGVEAMLWVGRLLDGGLEMAIPEIVDYELRRELLRLGHDAAIDRLDRLGQAWTYAAVTTQVLLRAAQLWADARKVGRPTADDRALDIDAILAATALELQSAGDEVVVATTNVGHIGRFVAASAWTDIRP